jgi:hypothetical protein
MKPPRFPMPQRAPRRARPASTGDAGPLTPAALRAAAEACETTAAAWRRCANELERLEAVRAEQLRWL